MIRRSPPTVGAPVRHILVVLLVLAVLLLSSSMWVAPATARAPPTATVSTASSPHSPVAGASPAAPTHRADAALASPLIASGSGTFFTTQDLPSPSFGTQSCVGGLCYNLSNDVSANLTSRGLLAAAYTTLTNQSPCPSMRATSISNIAFVTSSNGGASWSPAKYLGNPACSGPSAGYNDAWEPALTSLANGTLALAYVEYNLSAGQLPPLTPATWPPTESRLVFTESYNNGSTWTVPQVLNISNPSSAPPGLQFTPAVPSITAFENTLYLTWMSLTTENAIGAIALVVSSSGGAVWSPTIPVSTGSGALYSMNPQVTTDALGHVYIAYTSNVSQSNFFCRDFFTCFSFNNPVWQGSVWVASSYSNGTVFNYTQVISAIPIGTPSWSAQANPVSFGPFESPAPQIVASAPLGELFVAFAGSYVGNNSTTFFGTTSCIALTAAACLVNGLYFFSSFDSGASWFPGNIATVVFNPSSINPASTSLSANDSVTTLAMATSGGTVYLEAGFYNGTECFGTGPCGAQTEVVFNTPDGGTTFSTPMVVAAAYTPTPFAWTGEYDSVVVVNSAPEYFWTSNLCPAFASTPCTTGYPASALPTAGVEVSSQFTGVGVNLSFTASGLGPTNTWSVDVLGNVRTGSAGQTLEVSGVPTGVPIFWLIPNVYAPGYEFLLSSSAPMSPQTLTANLTVSATFIEYVSVTIQYSVPNLNSIACVQGFAKCPPSFYPGCLGPPGSFPNVLGNFTWGCFSEYFSPVPPSGPTWVLPGSVQQVGLNPTPPYPCSYPYGGFFGYVDCQGTNYTVSFTGWAGTGLGSVSSANQNITFVPQGPVVENATFYVTQVCYADFEVFGATLYIFQNYCSKFTSTLTIQEQGLPAGASWGVSLSGSAGGGSMQAAAGASIVNNAASLGLGTITPWNVPSATPGENWVGSIAGGGTFVLPHTQTVVVQYTLEPEANYAVPVTVRAVGLPNGTDGNVTLTDLATSALTQLSPSRNGTSTSVTAGAYLLSAATIQTTTGIDYLPAEVYSNVALLNESNQSGLPPFSIDLGGAASITVTYVPEYWLTMSAGLGGQATPASRWVISGQTVPLTATPNPGFVFLHWVGSGLGATSGSQATRAQVTIQPAGPVSEFAVFVPTPTPQYTVQVTPVGLPNGQAYWVTLGTTTYSGSGSFTIGNISAGSYPLAFPNITGVGAAISRYVVTSVSGPILPGGELSVTSNVAVTLTYETQYFVTVAAVGSGSVSAPTGGFWQTANSLLTITATALAGSVFERWVGAVDGGSSQVLGTSPVLQLPLNGSIDLIAQFGPAPVVVAATYSLTVNESGLPSGTSWQVALTPGHGASGTSLALVVDGLSGSYTLIVPTVYLGSGVRFVPTLIGPAHPVITSNTSESVAFQEEFLVSVSVSATGQPSTTNDSWVAAGRAFQLTAPASPVAGLEFEGWQGSGAGSYTGSSPSVPLHPSGPVTETATFAAATVSASTSASLFDWAALGIIVAVLVTVGVAEGLLLGRRRRKPPTTRPSAVVNSATPAAGTGASTTPPPAPTHPASPSQPWSEGPIPDDPAWSEK